MTVTPQIEEHLNAYGKARKKDIMLNNFLGGMAWGIGTVVGASVVVGIFGYVLNKLGVLSLIGLLFGN